MRGEALLREATQAVTAARDTGRGALKRSGASAPLPPQAHFERAPPRARCTPERPRRAPRALTAVARER